jgi:CHAD domain-containing protein
MTCFILTLLNRVEVRDSAGDNALDKLETGEVKYRVDNELKTCPRPIPSAQSGSDSSLRPIRFIMDAERKRAAKKAGPEETSSGQPAIGKAVKQDQVTGPATLTMPRVKPGEPASHLVRAALKGALARVQAADPAARRGDVEGIHRLRTSCRRLRSELRTVESLVDQSWRERLEGELKWLGGILGSVRDLDILRNRLLAATHTSRDAQGNGDLSNSALDDNLKPLFDSIAERHTRHSRAMRDELQGERFRQLVATIEQSAERPALTEAACEPCRTALPPLAQTAWRRLKKGARALEPSDPDEAYHEIRKRAKRARYTAELIAPALGHSVAKEAARFIRLTTQIQDALGEHQDAIVAATEIETFLNEHRNDPAAVQAAEKLLLTQRQAASEARERFFKVWRKLDRKKTAHWLKIKNKARA